MYATNPVQISKRFWDKLSPAEQKLLQDAAIEAQNYQRVVSREASGKAVAELKAKGMVYNDIAPAELARMRAEVKPVYDKFAASYEPAVVNAVQDRAGARLQALSQPPARRGWAGPCGELRPFAWCHPASETSG